MSTALQAITSQKTVLLLLFNVPYEITNDALRKDHFCPSHDIHSRIKKIVRYVHNMSENADNFRDVTMHIWYISITTTEV
jgi:hypothetical protein